MRMGGRRGWIETLQFLLEDTHLDGSRVRYLCC